MTEDEVLRALGHLVAVTQGWAEDTVDEYVNAMIEWGDAQSLEAACISIARAWPDRYRPTIPVIYESYQREHRFRRPAIEPSRIHCDGSGWKRDPAGDPLPCARCNPALYAVYQDPDKLERWLSGVELEYLDVGVEGRGSQRRWRDGYQPPRCNPLQDDPLPHTDGVRIAWEAYSQSVVTDGRHSASFAFQWLVQHREGGSNDNDSDRAD